MVEYMKETGIMINVMEVDTKGFQMVTFIKEIIKKGRLMVKDSLLGLMGKSTMVNGFKG